MSLVTNDIGYNAVVQQNISIENQLDKLTKNYSTDSQKLTFQLDNLDFFRSLNQYLFFFYFLLATISVYFLIRYTPTMTMKYKIPTIILLLTFPWWIDIVEQFLYFLGKMIVASVNFETISHNNY